MQRQAVLIILLSVAVTFLWALDANLLLLVYDTYITRTIAHNNIVNGRRAFPPGSTPSLEGKTVWITGSSSGIGAELAIQLSAAGVGHLLLSGRRTKQLESVADDCRRASEMRSAAFGHRDGVRASSMAGMRVSVVPFDMAGGHDVLDDAVSTALRHAAPSGIDVLVLNAGRYHIGPALDTDLDITLPALMQLNFAAPVQLSQKLLQKDEWRARNHGHIVTVSSLMGRGASPLNAAYSASKHALRGYFHSLAAEERSWLRVDVVLPGATDTGLWSGSYHDATDHSDDDAPHADDRSKMTVGRCAQLITTSMIGPNYFFFETWITRNPGLLWVYLASYAPMTFRLLTNIIAPLRMRMWRKNGEDALYMPTLLRELWECVVDYASGRSDHLLS